MFYTYIIPKYARSFRDFITYLLTFLPKRSIIKVTKETEISVKVTSV